MNNDYIASPLNGTIDEPINDGSRGEDGGSESKKNKKKGCRERFSRSEGFNMSQLCLNFFLTIIVLLVFCRTLTPNESTSFKTGVKSSETIGYTSCTLDSMGCLLDDNVLTFRCYESGTLIRTSFIAVEANVTKFILFQNMTLTCYSQLINHDSNFTWARSPNITLTLPIYDTDNVFADQTRAVMLYNKYTKLQLVASNPKNWDFRDYMIVNVYKTIEKGASQALNPIFSKFYELSAPLVHDAIISSNISYTCFEITKETPLDFFLRASSYTFIVTIAFMVLQLIAFIIYSWFFDD